LADTIATGNKIAGGTGRIVSGRELNMPDTENVAGDLRHIIKTVVHLQTRTVAGPAFLAEFAERRREVTRAVLRRAIQRREIRAGTDIDLFIDALGGAVTSGCSAKESR